MITTSEILPAPSLAPYVRCYAFREFDTQGLVMTKPWHAAPEMTMPFFFRAKPLSLRNPHTGQIIQEGSYGSVSGLGGQFNGEMTFQGHYTFFEILFQPNGFTQLFQIPASDFTNHIVGADDWLDSSVRLLYEQLCAAPDLAHMGRVADAFLENRLKSKRAAGCEQVISHAAQLVTTRAGAISVRQLAYAANMSPRSLERHFTEQVGVSPKVFCSVIRFNCALDRKLRRPTDDWTAIAAECGYYDQTHLIKDFKRFAGAAPASFLRQTPITQETYTSRVAS